jgi:hypothetical protein
VTNGIIHFTAQQRAAMSTARETPGIPPLPAGSKLAKELAGPIERLRHVTAAGAAARKHLTELEASRRVAERGNVREIAEKMRAGQDVPSGPSAVGVIDEEIAQEAARVDAARLATELAQGDIANAVRAAAGPFIAELDVIEERQRQAGLEAIDHLEAAFLALAETRHAREWVSRGGKPTSTHVPLPMIDGRGLGSLLDELRILGFVKPRQARPTTDADGTPRTGWAAMEKLHSGERVIGTPSNRKPATAP